MKRKIKVESIIEEYTIAVNAPQINWGTSLKRSSFKNTKIYIDCPDCGISIKLCLGNCNSISSPTKRLTPRIIQKSIENLVVPDWVTLGRNVTKGIISGPPGSTRNTDNKYTEILELDGKILLSPIGKILNEYREELGENENLKLLKKIYDELQKD